MQAQRFYNHKEAMVKTAVRTVILAVMKSSILNSLIDLVKSPKVEEFLIDFPFVTFYAHFMAFLNNIWLDLDGLICVSK